MFAHLTGEVWTPLPFTDFRQFPRARWARLTPSTLVPWPPEATHLRAEPRRAHLGVTRPGSLGRTSAGELFDHVLTSLLLSGAPLPLRRFSVIFCFIVPLALRRTAGRHAPADVPHLVR